MRFIIKKHDLVDNLSHKYKALYQTLINRLFTEYRKYVNTQYNS